MLAKKGVSPKMTKKQLELLKSRYNGSLCSLKNRNCTVNIIMFFGA